MIFICKGNLFQFTAPQNFREHLAVLALDLSKHSSTSTGFTASLEVDFDVLWCLVVNVMAIWPPTQLLEMLFSSRPDPAPP